MTDLVAGISEPTAAGVREKMDALTRNLATSLSSAITLGRWLTQAKTECRHGTWLPWLKAVGQGVTVRRLQQCMYLAAHEEEVPERATINEALALLARVKSRSRAPTPAETLTLTGLKTLSLAARNSRLELIHRVKPILDEEQLTEIHVASVLLKKAVAAVKKLETYATTEADRHHARQPAH